MTDDDIRDRWALAIAERDVAEAERDRLRAVVDELRRAAEGPVGDGNPDDDPYTEGNNAAWAYVLRCIEEGT